jgi:uncharacterized Fe-S cluster-containing radical SAM superfamily protein
MWKVCPIQGRQLKDVREEDLFRDFRICNTYRGGGGYDQFPYIAEKRGLTKDLIGDVGKQFVVQLYGCHLACPYCYVTQDGIFGEYKNYTSAQLSLASFDAWVEHDAGVFHLMGGAPALYHQQWHELLDVLDPNTIFHSDLLLTEKPYELNTLRMANRKNALYAVNIKGTPKTHYKNTGRKLDEKLFWSNLDKVVESGMNFYITTTKPDFDTPSFLESIDDRYPEKNILEDSFFINLINYEALK